MLGGYLPNQQLFRDEAVTKSFVPGVHAVITFTHEDAQGMTMEKAQEYKKIIINVMGKGMEPPVTAAHLERILKENLPPGMPSDIAAKIQGFDVQKSNKSFTDAVKEGTIRIESIATCMGCVVTTCVIAVKDLPKVVAGAIGWAKPIMQAMERKNALCISYRKKVLESEFAVPDMGQALQQMMIQQIANEQQNNSKQQQQGECIHEHDEVKQRMMTVGKMYADENPNADDEDREEDARESEVTFSLPDSPAAWLKLLYDSR